MSHFTVAVLTKPNQTLEQVLQPFHEYECTGVKDEYVVWIDEHDQYEEEFKNETRSMYVDGSGKIIDQYDDVNNHLFYREPTEEELKEVGMFAGSGCNSKFSYSSKDWGDGKGYRAKIRVNAPVGLLEKEIPMCEVYESIEAFMKDYHGYNEDGIRDGRFGRLTNPNAHWDWWSIGGRWSGMLMDKQGSRVDQGIMSNLDFNTVIEEAKADAAKKYDEAAEIIQGRTWKSWPDTRESSDSIDEARSFYGSQEVVVDLRKKHDHPFFDVDQFLSEKEAYINTKGNSSIATFAVIKDGVWYEKGDMGWWGCVSDEKDQDKWNGEFLELLKSTPDDHTLTIVDCHI